MLGACGDTDAYHRAVRAAASDEVVLTGAIHDHDVVDALRFHSRSYVHGHTVGGSNPSLIEALGAGNAVIAHDNPYNRWVAGPAARFFRGVDDLAETFDVLLDDTDTLRTMGEGSRLRHADEFTWDQIAGTYEKLLLEHLPAPR